MKNGKKFWGSAIIPVNDNGKEDLGREKFKNGVPCVKAQ